MYFLMLNNTFLCHILIKIHSIHYIYTNALLSNVFDDNERFILVAFPKSPPLLLGEIHLSWYVTKIPLK